MGRRKIESGREQGRRPADDREKQQVQLEGRHPVYGTRCSTVVTIDDEGDGVTIERRYSPPEVTGETTLRFVWPRPFLCRRNPCLAARGMTAECPSYVVPCLGERSF